jgi:hypothetical protein
MKARKAKETERIRAGLVAHRGPNVRGITRASGPRNVWTTPEERTAIGKKGGFARAVAMAARRSFDVAI